MQLVEHQSIPPRKCVQQEWSSTGETADAVGNVFQTADKPLLLPEREVHAEIGKNWFLDQDIPSHPKGGYFRILAGSLLWEEHLRKTRIRTTEGLTTCMKPHRGWTIAISSWNFVQKRCLDRLGTRSDHGHPRGN